MAPRLITGLSHLHSRGEYYHAPAPAGEACAFRAFGPILWVPTKLMMELKCRSPTPAGVGSQHQVFCLVVLLSCQWCFASATKRRRADGCDIDGSHQSPMVREMQLVGLYIGGVMYIAKMIGLASGTVMVTGWADTTCSYERVPHDKSISACVALLSLQQISGVAITQSTSVPRVYTLQSPT